jgi:lactoylglutathione lyase
MTDTVTAEPLRAVALYPSLTVRDLQTSVAWYRDVIGFEVEREIVRDGVLRAVALHAGDVRLLLNHDDGAKGHNRPKGTGMSMNVATRQSVDAVAAHIKARGGSLLTEPADMPWGQRVFRVVDPDGFTFAVSAPIAQ